MDQNTKAWASTAVLLAAMIFGLTGAGGICATGIAIALSGTGLLPTP